MSASPWASSLPGDLVRLIASRLLAGDLLDYVRFRAVCHPWRSGTASPRGRGVVDPRFHPHRWMMLPEGYGLYPGHPKLHGYVRFFNLDTGVFVRVQIPLFEDHCVLDSYQGLLVLQRDHDTAIRLLHPFTGDILDLPPLSTLLPQMHEDQQWTLSTWYYDIGCPPFQYRGKAYVVYDLGVDNSSKIFQIDIPLPGEVLQPPRLIATCTADKLCVPVHLVECDSEVLVIGYTDICSSKMLVYKLTDLIMGKYIPVTSIGDKAIFIQRGRTLSVSAKAFPTVVDDTIIIIHPMRHTVLQYHLSRGSWSPATDPCSRHGTEPGPCSFVQHIYTCCNHHFWNKGLLSQWERYGGGEWLQWAVAGELRQGVSVVFISILFTTATTPIC
ncbi:hypothetical protein HU200_044296 [Digitaria exilis]|uniref:KIB1-4 beta-propeller domain-containing protein n=1 Tax=Digitaria exilis TaxID=1010633 RepID=A0A835EFL1_9POAL|nr:hypothetical protein HU200_044296 [Digitaria exilis]